MPFSGGIALNLPDGAIASQAWVQQQLAAAGGDGYATPEQYGAVGDGGNDDTTAVQAAIDTGKTVLLTQTYRVTTTLLYKVSRTQIWGIGDNASVVCDATAVSPLFKASVTGLGRCGMRDVKLLNSVATAAGVGLDLSDMNNFVGSDIRVENFDVGLNMVDVASQTFYDNFNAILFFDCNTCINIGGSQANQHTFIGVRCRPKAGGGGTGVKLSDCRGITFVGLDVEANTAAGITGISLDATTREIEIVNPWIENCAVGISVANGVVRSGITRGTITGNTTDVVNNAKLEEFTFFGTNISGTSRWQLGPFQWGSGNPSGVLVADAGTMFLDRSGAGAPLLYVKQGGSGTSAGWVVK